MLRKSCITMALVMSLVFMCFVAHGAGEIDSELKAEVKASIDRGLRWLKENQKEDGSYGGHAGVTALVATAFMRSPRHYTEADGPFVKNAIKFIVSKTDEDGVVSDRGPVSYITAVALMALVETKNPEYKEIIEKAKKYLMVLQLDEGEGLSSSDAMYGGVGYSMNIGERGPRGDLSNLHFCLEAMKMSGVPEDDEVWAKAAKFIERCQNRSETNDQPWAKDDGGCIYHPAPRSEDAERSYGSMTYAGIESFIYANVDKNDDRVQAAVGWIKDNYTVDENPPIGAKGLYYYYHTMAKAFAVYGEDMIVDSEGVKHNWYEELSRKLISLQAEDGSWVNTADRWMESMPELVAAYSVLALSVGYPE